VGVRGKMSGRKIDCDDRKWMELTQDCVTGASVFCCHSVTLFIRTHIRDGSVGIATGNGLNDRGSEFESRKGQEFPLLHVVQTGSGAHPASYTMGNGALCPGLKRPGREADHSPSTSAEVKKMWIYTSTPPYFLMYLFYIFYPYTINLDFIVLT
jgi:hypothetical protein